MTKILYVEDNEDNVYMLSRRLKRKGFDLPDWTNSIWSAQAIIDEPELIVEIHKDSIEAGSSVITTSNYYATPLILKEKDLVKKIFGNQ